MKLTYDDTWQLLETGRSLLDLTRDPMAASAVKLVAGLLQRFDFEDVHSPGRITLSPQEHYAATYLWRMDEARVVLYGH